MTQRSAWSSTLRDAIPTAKRDGMESTSRRISVFFVCLFVYCVWQFKELDKTLQI